MMKNMIKNSLKQAILYLYKGGYYETYIKTTTKIL